VSDLIMGWADLFLFCTRLRLKSEMLVLKEKKDGTDHQKALWSQATTPQTEQKADAWERCHETRVNGSRK
jgi:hypothetical protein